MTCDARCAARARCMWRARHSASFPERDARASEGLRGRVLYAKLLLCTHQFFVGPVLYVGLVSLNLLYQAIVSGPEPMHATRSLMYDA